MRKCTEQLLCSQLPCWHRNKLSNNTFPEVLDSCHRVSELSILVMQSAIGHTCTFVLVYAPALKGNPRPTNWHLSVTPARCTDRSITRDVERRSVIQEKTEEGAWKMKTKRRERREMKKRRWRRRSKWRWDFRSLLETRWDESAAIWCFSTSQSFWFVSMCLWCCFSFCLCQSLLLDSQILFLLFWHSRCSYFTLAHTHTRAGFRLTLTPVERQSSI